MQKFILLTLLSLLMISCTVTKTIYQGPRLPNDQIARIICDPAPIRIDGKDIKWFNIGWNETTTLEVLPGTHTIGFRTIATRPSPGVTILPARKFSRTFTIMAGHIYRVNCCGYIKDVTGE